MRHRLVLVMLGAIGAAALAARGERQELSLEAHVQPEVLQGCETDAGRLRLPEPLPTQSGSSAICVEAEAFRSVLWQNKSSGVVAAEGAAGGKCIAFADEAVYRFVVARAGACRYWQRVWIPQRASWSHSVQIDDLAPAQLAFGQAKDDPAGEWFWIKGPRHHLKAGVHTLAVRSLHNGKRLDRWVLTSDDAWTPQGQGPPATEVKGVDAGTFVSAPISPLSLKAWKRLEVQVRGSAELEAATGDGPYRPVPKDGRLEGAAGPLRLRVRLRRDASGQSPQVTLGPVHYLADADDFFILRNDRMQLLLDRRGGRICGLQDLRTHRRYLPDGTAGALFELQTKSDKDPGIAKLSSDDAKLVSASQDGPKGTIVYALADGKLTATVTFDLSRDWAARLGIRIANRTDRDVIGVTFPRLPQAQAGADGSDDVLAFPSMSGRLIRRPGLAGTITNTHPMRAAIGFCDLHDAAGGLMLAPLDYPMVMAEFASRANPGGQSTTLSLTRRDRIRPGAEGAFTAALGVHAGDWHAAADWYRDRFTQTAGRPSIPQWVRDSDGWVTSADVEDMAGLGFVHMQMWRNTGYGGCPTYYWPNPAYRSEAQYKDLARRWRALGGHLGVYFHGNGTSRSYILADRIYGTAVKDIPADKRPQTWEWFVRNHGYEPDRKPPEKLDMAKTPEPAEHEEYPFMCWQAGHWRDYLRKWAVGIFLKEYGLDTPYWDTLACYDRQEFNPHYGLNGEGRGAMARLAFLRDMQAEGSAEAPGFYQTVEGGSELLGLAAGQLMSNFVQDLELARYTHPDQVYYIGHSNGWWTPPKTHQAACMAFRLNTKLDLIRLTPNVMAVVRARRWLAPWLNRSRFMDTLGLKIDSPQVAGALHVHRGPRGDALVATFMNWERAAGVKAVIDVGRYLQGERIAAFVVTQDHDPQDLWTRPAGAWTVEVPASEVSGVLCLARPAEAMPVVQAVQKDRKQQIRVFDPSYANRALKVRIETPEARFRPDLGPQGEHSLVDVRSDTPPKATFGRDIEYADYERLTRRLHADVTLTDGRCTLKTRTLVMPYFPDPDFEGERLSGQDAAEAHTGRRSLRITPQDKLRFFPLELVPGRRYRISLWVKRRNADGKGPPAAANRGGDPQVYANVHHHLLNLAHTFGHGVKPGEWTKIETLFDMQPGRDQPHLYMYNWQGSTQPAWFDTVHVEDVGPAVLEK